MSANVNAPSGLRPVRHLKGGVVRAARYRIASGLAANIFRGDPVKTSPGTNRNITVAVAGDTVIGVFDGCRYTLPAGDFVYAPNWVTGTTIKSGSVAEAFVYDDPEILYEVQATAGLVAADIGACADYSFAQAGNTLTGTSGVQLDSATIAVGQANMKIYDLVDRPDNAYGTNAKVLVLINEHELRGIVTPT